MVGSRGSVRRLPNSCRNAFPDDRGPGGIGKTTVALAVADRLITSYADGVHFVDLAPVGDHRLVPHVLAFVLGHAIHSDDPIPALISYLRTKQLLLVFDNCEHVIESAAVLVEELLRNSPKLHVVTTSREPLRAEGEHVHRLAPLAVPTESEGLMAAEALEFPAVRLFVERATARLDSFELTDADASVVGTSAAGWTGSHSRSSWPRAASTPWGFVASRPT